MKLTKSKKIIVIIIMAILMLTAGCTEDKAAPCVDPNYSDDHAVNVARCLQCLEDGSAYEIDEALTAEAPWQVGDIIASSGNGEGDYYIREFLGITKAGFYLVQDFVSTDMKKDVYDIKKTEPFAFMSFYAVTDMKTWPCTKSVCGYYISYYNYLPDSISEQGAYIDGAKDCEWIGFYTNDNVSYKNNYLEGKRNGLWIEYNLQNQQLEFISYYEKDRKLFQITFEGYKHVNISKHDPNAFVDFDENTQTIEYGYLNNGEKTGIWRKWDTQGVLIEERDYDLQP